MIKIESIKATKATVVRGGLRQPLLTGSHISADELATIEAEAGTIVYSVDENEVKELTFQAKQAPTPPAAKPASKPAIIKPAAKTAEPAAEPTGAETPSE